MTYHGTTGAKFGCEHCWPEDAALAWAARSRLEVMCMIVDDLHFIVPILACTKCRQRFLSVTTETIDWDDGDDPIHRIMIPVTDHEGDALVAGSEHGLRDAVPALDARRRSLHYDFPKGGAIAIYWGTGIRILPHD